MESQDDVLSDVIASLSEQHEASRAVLEAIRTERSVNGKVSLDSVLIAFAGAISALETRIIDIENR